MQLQKRITMQTLKTLCLSFIFVFSSAQAAQYKEGVHYEKLMTPATGQTGLTEIFSFYCGACYRFEPAVNMIKEKLPQGVVFNKSHVNFIGQDSAEVQLMLTKAVIIAKKLGIEQKINSAIFNNLHVKRVTFNAVNDIKNLFIVNGIAEDKFDKLYKSFAINMAAKKMLKLQKWYTQNVQPASVPAFIYDGEYKINPQQLKNIDDWQGLLNHLANK